MARRRNKPLKVRGAGPSSVAHVVNLRQRQERSRRTARGRVARMLLVLLRVALAGVFIASGAIKLFAPVEEFMASIDTFGLNLPVAVVRIVATVLPWIELLAGLLLLLGVWIGPMIVVHGGLLVVFSVLITQGIMRGLELDCGCFGDTSWLGSSPLETLIRDLVLLLIAMVLWRWRPLVWAFDSWKR